MNRGPMPGHSETVDQRIEEIDWLKGFAILCVVCIHAELYEGTLFYRLLINRAVMIFLFLFGVNSELWWRRQAQRPAGVSLRRWYTGRLERIVPSYWAMMAAWWLAVVFWKRPDDTLVLGPWQAFVTFLGYAPWVGTSWFVTVILQYIVVFPWLRRLPDKIGASATLVIGAVCAWASGWYMFYIVDAGKAVLGENIQWPGWYYHWIFAPRALWHVLAGIAVARFWNAKISTKVTALACAITLLGGFATVIARGAHNDVYGPIRELSVIQLVDVPLAVALLGIFRHLPLPRVLHKGLAFCGVWSWGIYLGHLLVHELVRISGFKAGLAPQVDRALYAVFLLVTGTIIAVVAEWTRARVAQLRVGNSAA